MTSVSLAPDALILLAHGSPDPDWLLPVEAAAERIRRLVAVPVAVATLEHGASLEAAARALATAGHRRLAVVPLFLSPGGRHLKRDIPALVASLQAQDLGVELRLAPGALGTDEAVLDALAAAAVRRAGLE